MTNQEHAEISRRLALAIGWPAHRISHDSWGAVYIGHGPGLPIGKFLDYRDPSVIWPVAERFNCFPKHHGNDKYWFSAISPMGRNAVNAETAALAVAMAVIKAKESK